MLIAVNETRLIPVRKAARERIAKCESEGLCKACMQPLYPGKKPIRDVHPKCYHATRRGIAAGKFTESQRVAEGKLGVAVQGRPPSNPVTLECEG